MKTTTRLLTVAAALMLLATPALAQDKEEKLTMNFAVKGVSTLTVSNISGDVQISGWDQESISVVAVKRAKGTDAAKKLQLVTASATLRGNDNRVVCESRFPNESEIRRAGVNKHNFNVSVEWTIRVPRSCAVEISRLISGDLRVADLNGGIDGSVVSGNVTGSSIGGKILLKITAGNIDFENVNGRVRIEGVSGDMTLKRMTGAAEVKTTSGTITIDAIDIEGLDLASTSGDVVVDVASPLTFGKYKIRAFSGDITMTLPEGSGFTCYAKSNNGEISSSFPLQIKRSMSGASANGTAGGGGAELSLSTFDGDIKIRK